MSTAPIDWPAIRCWKAWCSGFAPAARCGRPRKRWTISRGKALNECELLPRLPVKFSGSPGRSAGSCARESDCGQAVEQLEALAPELPEERNMQQVALLIARCALARKESRGAHFRTDYPETCEAFARHSVVSQQTDVTFR